MIHCQICKDTKRHLVYFNRRNPGEIVNAEKYESFFEKSNVAFKMLSDKICGSKDPIKFMDQFAKIDKSMPEFKTWHAAWRLDMELNEQWVSKLADCENCVKDEMEKYYLTLKGDPINGLIFGKLAKEGKIHSEIVELAKDETMKSFMLIGPTGKGKTLLLMLNYNRLVKKFKSTEKIKYIKETELRQIINKEELAFKDWLKTLNSIDFFFIDEMYREEVWKDLGVNTERDRANGAALNMWLFKDYLYDRGDKIIVQGAGQYSPDERLPGLKENSAAEYWRRDSETFKEIKRIG